MRRVAILIASAIALSACLGSDFADSLDGAWELQSGSHLGQPIPTAASHPITLTLDGDQIGGTAACNSYGGTFDIRGSDFSLSEGLSWTEMACMPLVVMESEQAFLNAMTAVDSVSLDDVLLVLSGPDTELIFSPIAPVPTAELTGTVWVLDGLIKGESVSSVIGDPATLELFSDGSFIGSTGCRTLVGSYIVSGAEVVFTEFSANGECSPDLADQDSQVISGLEGGFRVEIDGTRMTTWVAGDEGLSYRAEP